MKIHELSPARGSVKKKKVLGRGTGSGHGGTSGRGHKGQKSRAGGRLPRGFEGGQMPLQRRIPKRGFKNIFKRPCNVINVRDLNRFPPHSSLDHEALREAGLAKKNVQEIKLLGEGEVSHPLEVKVHGASRSAREKIEAAGGKVEILSLER